MTQRHKKINRKIRRKVYQVAIVKMKRLIGRNLTNAEMHDLKERVYGQQ